MPLQEPAMPFRGVSVKPRQKDECFPLPGRSVIASPTRKQHHLLGVTVRDIMWMEVCTKETDNWWLKQKPPKPEELFICLKCKDSSTGVTLPSPACTYPCLPMSLLLWCHQEWHDTAGKETGSLWDLLLTLLQCNGPPSSWTFLGNCSLWPQPQGPPHCSPGSGTAEGGRAQPRRTQHQPGLRCYNSLAWGWNVSIYKCFVEFAWWRVKPCLEDVLWLLMFSLCPCHAEHQGHGTAYRTAVVENAISILPLLGISKHTFSIFNIFSKKTATNFLHYFSVHN